MGAPGWRNAFDRVERTVGAPLERAVASSHFGTGISLWVSANRALERTVRRRIDAQLANVLHLLNMPTRSDVQRLSRQLATLTSETRALSSPADLISSYIGELQGRTGTEPTHRPAIEQGPGQQAAPSVRADVDDA